ncbi:MAG: PorV/PorQ family protein, partial [Bacteroidota bacterium]
YIKFAFLGIISCAQINLQAGNPERAGQAGATQLLINPYSRSSGMGGANTSLCRGLESQFLNVAGLAHTRKTELLFARTSWLAGSGININTFGFSQHVGETGAIGLGIMALDGGDIPITTESQPEGGLGTFSPLFLNIGLSYAKGFSDNIFGGVTLRVINEQISNVSAKGVAIDAGIQYVTGKNDQIHFGIALKNVGPKMSYRGDGMSTQITTLAGYVMSVEQKSQTFEMPSLVNIGGAYDFYLSKDSTGVNKDHRLTAAYNFTSNSFTYDQHSVGVEYGFKQYLMLRAGFMFEKNILSKTERMTAFTGPSCGVTFELPFGESKKSSFALDYSYRFTNPFSGCHTIGARINL